MFQSLIHTYYKLLDETISSSTFIVLMIACLIFAVWSLSPSANANSYKWNIIEAMNNSSDTNTVMIDGVEYQLKFTKVAVK